MKKNLKVCIEHPQDSERQCLVDMNSYDLIEASGMEVDLRHRRSAHMSGAWRFSSTPRVQIPLGGADLSAYRYLSFAVFSVGGAGGEFTLFLESESESGDRSGYDCTLCIEKEGWNEYRIELPFLHATRRPRGLDHIDAILLDSVAGGVFNRPETVLYLDSMFLYEELSPLYCRLPELKGAALFARSGKYAIVDRRRVAITPDGADVTPPEAKDGTVWLPMAPIAAVLCHSAVVDTKALTLNFTYRRKKYAYSANKNVVSVNGEEEKLNFYPVAREGCLFFPADYVREFFRWRQIFTDPTGLVVLSNRRAIFDRTTETEKISRLVADLTFTQPDSRTVLEDLHRNVSNPNRCRLLLSQEALLQLRRDAKSDANLGEYVLSLKETYGTKSSAFRALPICAAIERSESELQSEFALSAERILAFTTLYRVTGDKAYCERAAAECEALAAFADWNPDNPTGMATLSFAVALCYDWCHHVWSEARKAVIERALLRNVLRPSLELYAGKRRMWYLHTATSAQVNSGVLASVLALADIYPETAARLIGSILSNIACTFTRFSPDGGWEEGVEAWERAATGCAMTVAMLESACGKSYGLASAPGFAMTAYFPILSSGRDAMWNFHNSPLRPADTSVLSWFASYFGDTALGWLRRRQLLNGTQAVHPLDVIFYRPTEDGVAPTLPLDAVWRRAGLAVLRSGWGEDANLLGLHAGSNHAPDGDLDAGSFLLEMGGERFFGETGGENSLPMLLRRRAEGQNTFAVDPADAPAPDQNPDAIAKFTEMRSSAARTYVIADLTSVSDRLVRAKRGALLADRRTLAVIQDELVLNAPATVVWNFYTDAEVQLSAGGRSAKLKKNGKTLLCRLCGVGSPARLTAEALEGSALCRLSVCVEGKERIRMALACKLVEEETSFAEKLYEIVPMSTWGKEKK